MHFDSYSFKMDLNTDYYKINLREIISSYFFLQPASQQIELEIEYAPEVEAQEIFVHAKSGIILSV